MENIETFWVVELRGEDMCLIVFGHPGDCTMLCPYFLDMTWHVAATNTLVKLHAQDESLHSQSETRGDQSAESSNM